MQNPNEENIVIEENANEKKVSVWRTGWRKELIDWVVAIGVAVVVAFGLFCIRFLPSYIQFNVQVIPQLK